MTNIRKALNNLVSQNITLDVKINNINTLIKYNNNNYVNNINNDNNFYY